LLKERLRLEDGTLVRNKPKQNTLWADDLYMSVSLLSKMGQITGDEKYFNDAITQVKNFNKYLWDADKHLYWHCYYTTNKQNGVAHWGRANGWIMLAQVELLKSLPQNNPHKEELIDLLIRQILGIVIYQSKEGLWYQLVDKNDSYLEASCSTMFIYGIASAINNQWLSKSYAGAVLKGWSTLVKEMLTENGEMKGVCIGTNIEDNLPYYYNRPTSLNDKHGVGVFLNAGIEVYKLVLLGNNQK